MNGDEGKDVMGADLCCSFSYWKLQTDVGRHRTSRGLEEKAPQT